MLKSAFSNYDARREFEEYQRSVKELLEVKGEQLYHLECSPNKILCINTGSDFPETKWNDKILYQNELKKK